MDSVEGETTRPGAVLDRISEGVLALDEDLVYTYANEGAMDLLGMDREDIVGEYIRDVFPEAEESITAARETGEQTSYERYNEQYGRWFDVSLYPDDNGLTIVFRDITERKEREQELERYERIVENLPVAVGEGTTGDDAGFAAVNSAAVEMFDADSKADLEDHTIGDAYAEDDDRKRVSELLRERGRLEGKEVRLETLSDEPFWASMTASAETNDEGELRFIGIIEDITERKERERQLKQLHDATQDLVGAESPAEVAQRASAAAERRPPLRRGRRRACPGGGFRPSQGVAGGGASHRRRSRVGDLPARRDTALRRYPHGRGRAQRRDGDAE